MATLKAFPTLVSSSTIILKHSASTKLSQPICDCFLRRFTSGNSLRTSSKRKIQTFTGWQPHLFNPQPPPSLVSKMPKIASTSISARPQDSMPSAQKNQYEISSDMLQIEGAPNTPTEQVEPRSIPVKDSFAPPEPKLRSKLRARKAAIKLTPGAVSHLRKLLDQPIPKLIKIGVRNRGCSGLAYHLEYVDKAGLLDEEVEQDGVKVIIDSKALFSIIGSEMDWVEDKLHQKFVFNNPNIKEQCGCGESFMV